MNMVERFISEFKKGFDEKAIIDCFLKGNCYHFAVILREMFVDKYGMKGEIVYDMVEGHFYFKLSDKYYDIRGQVCPKREVTPFWKLQIEDELLYKRILRDCVYKERIDP